MALFEEYKNHPDESVRERANNWAIAIVLQCVDGLNVSEFLIQVARQSFCFLHSFYKRTLALSIVLGWVNYAMVNAICNSQQLIGVLNLPILHQADAELQRIENQFEITETGRFSNFKFSV